MSAAVPTSPGRSANAAIPTSLVGSSVGLRDLQFLRAHTSRLTKITVPGPFTMSQQAQDDHYGAPDAVAMAYGGAVRGEIEDLFEGGAETIILGVLDLSTDDVETADTVAARIRRAFEYVGAERLVAAPDCGMKYLSRASAYGKLEALVAGARLASATQ